MVPFQRVRARGIAVAAALSGVLLASGVTAASASVPYTGAITFGAPTVSRTCSGGAARTAAISLPYNASHLTAPISRRFYATFIYVGKTLGWASAATPVSVTIRPGQIGSLNHRFTIPTDRAYNTVQIGVLDQHGRPETFERFGLTCATTAATTFRAPVVVGVSHPCSGATTARVTSNSARTWTLTPVLANGHIGTAVTIAPHATRTVRIGLASAGADRFTLEANTASSTAKVTVGLIAFSEACTR